MRASSTDADGQEPSGSKEPAYHAAHSKEKARAARESMTQAFEWDPAKATSNSRKHKVTFEEAASVFSDPQAYTFTDPDHSIGERRWLTLGISRAERVLAVIHADRTRAIRIISARRATRHERGIYGQS